MGKTKRKAVSAEAEEKTTYQEQEDFPRGGYAGLEPLEYKEIAAKAARDALFTEEGQSILEDANLQEPKPKRQKNTKKASRSKKKANETETVKEVKIEQLTLGRLNVGTKIFGMITEINEYAVTVSLPNSLFGVAPITEISKTFTDIIQKLAEAEDEDDSVGLPDIKNFFHIGQWLPTIVIGLPSEEKKNRQSKKTVELSFKPDLVNSGLRVSDLQRNMTLSAAVVSAEDHGWVLDIGIEAVTGFIHKNEAKLWGKEPNIGQIVTVAVKKADNAGRTVNFTADPQRISKEKIAKPLSTINSFVPGFLIDVLILSHVKKGITGKVQSLYDGIADWTHLGLGIVQKDTREFADYFPLSQHKKARVLFVNNVFHEKVIGLSFLPHILDLSVPKWEGPLERAEDGFSVKFGTMIDKIRVKRVDPSLGLSCEIDQVKGIYGKVQVTKVSDAENTTLDAGSGEWKIGSEHKARVLKFDPVDGVVHLTLQPSVIKQKYLRVLDIKPGTKLYCTINMLQDNGMEVQITDKIKGFVSSMHMSDVVLNKPDKKFKPGTKLNALVWNINQEKNRVYLTLKRSLLQSDLPKVTCYDDYKPNLITMGMIKSIDDRGCYISFFGQEYGFLPVSEMNLAAGENHKRKFRIGQTLKCRVDFINTETKKVRLSLLLDAAPRNAHLSIAVGQVVQGTVTAKSYSGLILKVKDSEELGFLPIAHLSDNSGNHLKLLLDTYQIGSSIEELLVLEVSQKMEVKFSIKPSLLKAIKNGSLVETIEDLKKGHIYSGTVYKVLDSGVIIQHLGNLKSIARKNYLSDSFVTNIASIFTAGQSVKAKVVEINEAEEKAVATLKDSDLTDMHLEDAWLLKSYFEELKKITPKSNDKFQIGSVIDVKLAKSNTLKSKVELEDGYSGLFAAENVGSKATEFRVLDVDLLTKTVVLSEVPESGKADYTIKKSKMKWLKSAQNEKTSLKAKIVFIKDEYLVLEVNEKVIGFAPKQKFNTRELPFELYKVNQELDVIVYSVPEGNSRTVCAILPPKGGVPKALINPIDAKIKMISDLEPGVSAKVKIVSKDITQLNVELAENVFGRIHVSQIYDDYSDITDKKNPLAPFEVGQILNATVLKVRKTKKDSNEKSKEVIELAINSSSQKNDLLHDSYFSPGTELTAYIRKIADGYLIADMSPNFSARIKIRNFTKDAQQSDLSERFTYGEALKCELIAADVANRKFDLKHFGRIGSEDLDKIKAGTTVSGKITKVEGDHLIVSLAESSAPGSVFATDIFDEYVDNPTSKFSLGQSVTCFVLSIDHEEKKFNLSLRPSKFDKSAKVADPEITSINQISRGKLLRGYINNIAQGKGCFVNLSADIVALVKFSQLSDDFVRDWESVFKKGQLVKGRIINVNEDLKRIEMSFKGLANYSAAYEKLKVGQIVSGHVRNTADFGVFVSLQDGLLHGLCHKTEVADYKVDNFKERYKPGDAVKAIIVKLDKKKMTISLSFKPSRMNDANTVEDTKKEPEGDESLSRIIEQVPIIEEKVQELSLDDFDWKDTLDAKHSLSEESSSEAEMQKQPKKKQKKETEKTKSTETLPSNSEDYEKLLLGSPNSSFLWINYMALQLQLSEIDKARLIAERALKTISFREEQEKMNVWIALMNLELKYGTQEQLDEVFQRAIKMAEPKPIYLQLAVIYENNEKFEEAAELWSVITRKFSLSSKAWWMAGQFHLKQKQPDKARDMLQKALKTLDTRKHVKTIVKFGQLEFRFGEAERARTIFEGVITKYPRRVDIWSVYIDKEIVVGEQDRIRTLFRRAVSLKGSSKKKKFLFKKWLTWERSVGNEEGVEEVKQKALEYVNSQ